MANAITGMGPQLRSLLEQEGILELSLVSIATPQPGADGITAAAPAVDSLSRDGTSALFTRTSTGGSGV